VFLSNDSDYNYLVNRVNANRLPFVAVTSFHFQSFFDSLILLSKNENLTKPRYLHLFSGFPVHASSFVSLLLSEFQLYVIAFFFPH